MAPTQIFQQYLSIVSAESGISEDRILSKSREADVVDARSILFYILHIYSLYPAQIAREAGMSERQVNNIINSFQDRLRQSRFLQNVLLDVKERCPELRNDK